MVETCDAFLGPDSALVHFAGALDIPTIALYGPFSWKTRTSVFGSVEAIQGHAECAPCYHHSRAGKEWPDDCVGASKNLCAAMCSIGPTRVAAKVRGMLLDGPKIVRLNKEINQQPP
jgi:ADP-heptose:LPS heptosyltransferase